MATTRLSDVIYGATFLPTTRAEIVNRSLLRTSGIAGADARIAAFARAPGDLVHMPFWNRLSGNSNVSTDDPAQNATPKKLSQSDSLARKIRRNVGIQAADLVTSLIGEDPIQEVAAQIADYWVGEEQRILILILNGLFATSGVLNSTNLLNVASEDPAGNSGANAVYMDAEVSANAHALLGDQGIRLNAVAIHSRIFWNLRSAGAITYDENPRDIVPGSNRDMVPFWDGKRVVVSDEVPSRAGTSNGTVYTSYFFGADALGYEEATGAGGPKTPVEIEREASAGNGEGIETVWYRRHWVMSPRGVSFTGTPAAAAGVTDAELSTVGNWTRVYDPKLIRIVAVTTNG